MRVVSKVEDIRKYRWADPLPSWGLVPTMGFLHEGHLSLVRRARAETDRVAVSIFVNPAQFNDSQDLAQYPRDLDRDLALLQNEHVDLVWTPAREEVYPKNFQTYIDVEEVARPLEGQARPGHFRGVATVVAKLFNVFQPQRAYFGQKDAQQLAVIQRMVQDLNFDVEIVACPTVRESDGLAMSSRNALLTGDTRKQAACLYEALCAAKSAFEQGERQGSRIKRLMLDRIRTFDLVRVDYVSVAHPETLQELSEVQEGAIVSLAVWVGGVRLIDNLVAGKNT